MEANNNNKQELIKFALAFISNFALEVNPNTTCDLVQFPAPISMSQVTSHCRLKTQHHSAAGKRRKESGP